MKHQSFLTYERLFLMYCIDNPDVIGLVIEPINKTIILKNPTECTLDAIHYLRDHSIVYAYKEESGAYKDNTLLQIKFCFRPVGNRKACTEFGKLLLRY